MFVPFAFMNMHLEALLQSSAECIREIRDHVSRMCPNGGEVTERRANSNTISGAAIDRHALRGIQPRHVIRSGQQVIGSSS